MFTHTTCPHMQLALLGCRRAVDAQRAAPGGGSDVRRGSVRARNRAAGARRAWTRSARLRAQAPTRAAAAILTLP